MRVLLLVGLVVLLCQPVHAQTYNANVRTGFFGPCSCRPPAPEPRSGTDPATLALLGNVLANQGLILNQLGRVAGQQAAPPQVILAPLSAPAAPAPVYQPTPLPIAYNPQPLPGGYQPQPLPGGYQPQPLPGGYQPQPLPGGYAPQVIVAPTIGTNPAPAGGYNPEALPLTPGVRGVPRGYGGGSAPGIDFHYYGATGGIVADGRVSRNGSTAPPAPQAQSYTRSPRPER